MTAAELLRRVRIVLLRPRNPENLGAVARAMKNFGLSEWALVDPRTLDFHAARRVAVHSEEILDRPKIVERLTEAAAGSSWVVGTSSRSLKTVRTLDPQAFAEQAMARARAGNQVTLVFGDERSGMSNEELEACHTVVRIPTDPEQPSLNLAQSVAIFGFCLRQQALPAREAVGTPRREATVEDLANLGDALGQALVKSKFLDARRPRHAVRDLCRALERAQLSRAEAQLWMAALRSLAKPPKS